MKRNIVIITALVCAVACVAGVMVLARTMPAEQGDGDTTAILHGTEAVTTGTEAEVTTAEDAETKPPYVSPKDFAEMRKTAPHIHGWLHVENSYIDYPIVQHPTDDGFYDRLTPEGEKDDRGCIITEHIYNRTDFEDPVTVLYGHYVGYTGHYEFFGGLQEMYNKDNYEKYKNITVYHEEKELHYEFYASVRYDNEHIPWNYDFSDPESYNKFLNRIKSFDGPEGVFAPDVEVTPDDKLLIFSTCYSGGYGANKDIRYIVVARLVETITE
ncbi:MAG: class B sortase [Clostridia bacterium]|nr:class B sortase [Clostridia bacterium]